MSLHVPGRAADGPTTSTSEDPWPPLPFEEWRDTAATLHRYAQMVGKVRLELAPYRNHWWHVTSYVGTHGLTTGPMPAGQRTLELTLDLRRHELIAELDDGRAAGFSLTAADSCADFHTQLFDLLGELDVEVRTTPEPYDLDSPPFPEDTAPRPYDTDAVERYWRALRSIDGVFGRWSSRFLGKQSPVHLFWHSFDLAVARFSGRRAPLRDGADRVTADAYSHEVIAAGFWVGDDRTTPYPAFYSYTAPEPPGLTDHPIAPAAARWLPEGGMAVLPYDEVRRSDDPGATLLTFLASTYAAGAAAADWDVAALATRVDPEHGGA